jgi:hypothetical protein
MPRRKSENITPQGNSLNQECRGAAEPVPQMELGYALPRRNQGAVGALPARERT